MFKLRLEAEVEVSQAKASGDLSEGGEWNSASENQRAS